MGRYRSVQHRQMLMMKYYWSFLKWKLVVQLLLQFGVLTVFGVLFDMTNVRGKSLLLGVSLDSFISFDNSRNQIIEKVGTAIKCSQFIYQNQGNVCKTIIFSNVFKLVLLKFH